MIHQLDKAVNVRLDIPSDYVIQSGNKVVVYYLEDDGMLTECPTTYHEENGSRYVMFETNHFSPYVMAEVAEKIEEPEDDKQEETTENVDGTQGDNQEETSDKVEGTD